MSELLLELVASHIGHTFQQHRRPPSNAFESEIRVSSERLSGDRKGSIGEMKGNIGEMKKALFKHLVESKR